MMLRSHHIAAEQMRMERIATRHLVIDPERFLVTKHGQPVVLTRTEFYILYLMMSSNGKIQSRSAISRFAWGVEALERPRTIDTHISNIRKKIGKVEDRDVITVIKGVGYKLNDAVTS